MDACICGLEEQGDFKSPRDYDVLLMKMSAAYDFREVPVQSSYDDVGSKERWFRCNCGVTWRLVEPDPPFLGVFEKVMD